SAPARRRGNPSAGGPVAREGPAMTRAPLAAAVAVAALALPASASAKAVCVWNLGTHVMSVTYTSTGGTAELSVDGSGEIELNGTPCAATAGVNTVDLIVVHDTSGKDVGLIVDDPVAFGLGPTAEPASPEIE